MRRIYKCLECSGTFTAFIYRYDSSPRGDDETVCPCCGAVEPRATWEDVDDETYRALAIIGRLRTDGHINNKEQGALRRAILLPEGPQGEWILISERLPDRFGDVLVTFQISNREPIVYRAVYVNGKFDLDNGDTWNWNDPEIKAWMPLPEAYKEVDDD